MKSIFLGLALLATGCATTSAPVKIGNGAYIMSATGAASPFGINSNADNIQLIQKASQNCTSKGLEFEMVSDEQIPTSPGRRGIATVTFKCTSRT